MRVPAGAMHAADQLQLRRVDVGALGVKNEGVAHMGLQDRADEDELVGPYL